MDKSVFTAGQTSTSVTEGGILSSQSGTQEDRVGQNTMQPDGVQVMYCKELVYGSDGEFTFEELRAQHYYKKINEKFQNLNKVKEELQLQIEQKKELIKGRTNAIQHQQPDVPQHSHQTTVVSSAPVPTEAAPFKIYCEPEASNSSYMRNSIINRENMGQGTTGVKQSSQASKSFSTYGENVGSEKHIEKPNTRSSTMSLKSLKLPTSILKCRQSAPACSNEKDASLSRPEEAIINGHCNKTLCRSPEDTFDFVRAAQLASTPFGGPGRQNPSQREQMGAHESLNKTDSFSFKEPNSEPRAGTNKLSPIQEISHEWGYNSLASTHPLQPESKGKATALSGIPEVIQPLTRQTVSAPALETKTENPCSLDVRKALLNNVDLRSTANFSRKVGPLPDPDDLQLDGKTLFFLKKMGDQGMRLYFSSGGSVLVKVDESTVPWDFYISSQLKARLPADHKHGHAQSTCYLYENGSFTLWKVPQGQTIQDLLEDQVDRLHVPLLTIRLLEMVKQMHSCRLVHGALRPETLMVCHSCEDSVICMDFSNSLDLELQTDVKTVQSLPSAQDYIKQGLLLPSASPYKVDLCGIAEIVHLLLFGKNMKIIKEASCWTLADDCGPLDWQRILDPSNLLDPLWQDFFHNLLNPGDNSTEFILTNLINNLKNTVYEDLECQFSL
ncbi:mitotic checkpoint serine/threonine-protein kinase BUB1 beta isoform X2 [Hemibagrus wyckioides]|uniref:mitotic checkpoint serine/threonine-protein kinase BUB1 beta isoform X2 n=1 Tax=Hemibagrus wyckioides TaxID=337641 RepID=UPI00266CA249|nr:mitotic checkpoint serine/threonine-protein kinase BUB1 beta isoform X2 [Hemibagrus wyckioides]